MTATFPAICNDKRQIITILGIKIMLIGIGAGTKNRE